MKRASALAVLEFSDIPTGVFATDALAKRAPIAFLRAGTVTRGRFLTIVGGSPAAVEEAVEEALHHGASAVLDHTTLADIHPELYDAMMGMRLAPGSGALAVCEADTVSLAVRAAEAALKGTTARLVEIRLADAGLAGKGLFVLTGELHDLEAAVEIASGTTGSGAPALRCRILPAPHEASLRALAQATHFAGAPVLDLDGEAS
jgi:microcompartment protein CcmL/EutN